MSEHTYIKGKDLDLESSIEHMQSQLLQLGFDIEESSWLNPVSHVYSVHIRDKSCFLMFTNGKGSTKKACLASALGEYFERLSCNYFFADFYLGKEIANSDFVHYPDEKWFAVENNQIPDGLLNEQLWAYYNPDKQLQAQHLYDLNSGYGERGICALPYHHLKENKPIYFPVNLIANCYVSNGMSAGNSKNEARVQSLSEIFERYIKNRIIAEGICLPEVPQQVLQRYPGIVQAIKELQQHGYKLRICDASLGGKFPVMNVTLINPKNATVFASFGAHPSFEVALERTLTELLQGRSLDQLNGFQSPSFDLDEVADPHNLETHFIDSSGLIAWDFFKQKADFEFADWDFDNSTENEFEFLSKLIHDMGFEIFIKDFYHLGVYCCRIIVPGMSDIYPVADLYENNSNEGAFFRKRILNLSQLNQHEIRQLYRQLNDGGYHDFQTIAEFIGIAPDANTKWASLRIGEFKAMLCLASQHEDTLEWIDWCLHSDQLSQTDYLDYQCIQALMEYDQELEFYQTGLETLFGHSRVQKCLDIIRGKIRFDGLHDATESLQGFDTHQKLLQGYLKLQQAKMTAKY